MKLQISSSILRRARSLPKSRVSNWCTIPTVGAMLGRGKHEKRVGLQEHHCRAPRHRAEQAGGEEISLHEEGLPTAVALRSSGLVLMLSVVAYLINPRWMKWSSLDPSGGRHLLVFFILFQDRNRGDFED